MKHTHVKRLVLTAACLALCVVLPLAFHTVPNAGNIFLPMHIPVLLCGLMCSWPYGFICGLLGPVLSSLCTGMPPLGYVPSMMLECAAYGLVAGIGMTLIRTKKTYLDLYISLTAAMLLGRVVAGIGKTLIFAPGTPVFAWVATAIIEGIPGLAIQFVLLPTIVYALMRAKILPMRYSKVA